MKQSEESKSNIQTRPPVVVIMGHVDHGKTSILDFMRKAKVAEGEAGGITQSIGAYQVEHQGKLITFIDTPGHEAFYAMRSRGAKVADIAVLVVAADDGIMPQTKEAIEHIKHAGVQMIVAINKIDKPNANARKVKSQLLEEGIVVEEFQGKVPSAEVSAKTGQGMDGLLEIINLVAEMEELSGDVSLGASGAVIEAELDHRRGPTATLLIKDGMLRQGDIISLSSTFGKVMAMEDFRGTRIKEGRPGTPVLVTGLTDVPLVGDTFKFVSSIVEAELTVSQEARKHAQEGEVIEVLPDVKILNIVLKADVQGTLEAAREILRGIKSENIQLRILSQSVGEIMEAEIKLAAAANALIVGFRTKINHGTEGFAKQMKVQIVTSEIIYELVEKVRAKIDEFLSIEKREVEVGELKVLAIFLTEKTKMIVGGKVTEGEMRRGIKVRIMRKDEVIGEGRIAQVKIGDKIAEKAVGKGAECGVLFEGEVKIKVGDTLQGYQIQGGTVKL